MRIGWASGNAWRMEASSWRQYSFKSCWRKCNGWVNVGFIRLYYNELTVIHVSIQLSCWQSWKSDSESKTPSPLNHRTLVIPSFLAELDVSPTISRAEFMIFTVGKIKRSVSKAKLDLVRQDSLVDSWLSDFQMKLWDHQLLIQIQKFEFCYNKMMC